MYIKKFPCRLRSVLKFAGALCFFMLAQNVWSYDAEFTMSKEVNTSDGYVKLEWEGTENAIFELQQDTTSGFATARTIYKGPDLASFVSGLNNGTYYYRVREEGGEWSSAVVVNVEHQSLQLAFSLFGIGALVFLMTVYVVIHGVRKSATE